MKNRIPYVILATILLLTFAFVTSSGLKANAQEALFWTGKADGTTLAPVSTPILAKGALYNIVVSATFWYNYAGTHQADAQYYTTGIGIWNWTNHFPAPNGHSFLLINGNDVNWGPFSNGDTNHTYSITYTGQGLPISFQVHDWMDEDTSSNACGIEISMYETQPAPTPTPTFVPPPPIFVPYPISEGPTPSPPATPVPPTTVSQAAIDTTTPTAPLTPLSASAFCSVTVMKGQTWYFFVQTLWGVWPYNVQWYEGNTLMADQTDLVLIISKTAAGTYTYSCKVTDAQGTTVTTNTVTLTVK